MEVWTEADENGFRFDVADEGGSREIRSRVFMAALQSEQKMWGARNRGAINADNGSAWYLSGVPDARWNNDDLATLRRIPGSSFEAVDGTKLQVSANSGEAKPS